MDYLSRFVQQKLALCFKFQLLGVWPYKLLAGSLPVKNRKSLVHDIVHSSATNADFAHDVTCHTTKHKMAALTGVSVVVKVCIFSKHYNKLTENSCNCV